MTKKSVSITPKQARFIKKHDINLSRLLQRAIIQIAKKGFRPCIIKKRRRKKLKKRRRKPSSGIEVDF